MVILLPEVDTTGVDPHIWFAVGIMARTHLQLTGRPMVITALRNGSHMGGSLHYKGRAVDVRTKDIGIPSAVAFAANIKQALFPFGFDVVLENTPAHLHVEYDPKETRTLLLEQRGAEPEAANVAAAAVCECDVHAPAMPGPWALLRGADGWHARPD